MDNLLYKMHSTTEFHYYMNNMGTLTAIPRQTIIEPQSLSVAKDIAKEVSNG